MGPTAVLAGSPWDGEANAAYGDYRDPREPGAGGGSSYSSGAGGGLARILAGAVRLEGAILADGAAVIGRNGGGGAGGGVYLKADRLSGLGRISANGGASSYHGAGGGGRVAVYYGTLSGFDAATQATAHGGTGGRTPGAVGTLYFKANDAPGELRLANHGTSTGMWTPLGSATGQVFEAESIVLSGPGMVAATVGGAPVSAHSIALLDGAVLTHPVSTADDTYSLQLDLTGELRIDATSRIDVTGRGYPQGRASGNTTLNAATGESGGSHGGLGAAYDGVSGPVYDDYRDPRLPGAGGGSSYSSGAGGGLVRITAQAVALDGAILADGASVIRVNGGGGAGGGVCVRVERLSGVGRLEADGGESSYQGGGAGGRVAVYYTECDGFDLDTRATAHPGRGGGVTGAAGTVYTKPAAAAGRLLISSHGGPAGAWTPLGLPGESRFEVEQLVISGTNVLVAPEHEMPISAEAVSILGGAVLTHRTTTSEQVYGLRMTIASNLWVDAASRIDVTGRGYPQGYTAGNSRALGATGESGGSYGGLGTAYDGQPNPIYGDAFNPDEPGSGGGSSYSSGAGGGLVRITAGGARVDGAILANGSWNPGWNGGGGSGGAILLNVGSLAGEGFVAASGGDSSYQGAGGGGRVAVYSWSGVSLSDGQITAAGGTGPRGQAQAGTVRSSAGPFFAWASPASLMHGSARIDWYAFGADPASSSVDLYALRSGETYPLAAAARTIGGAAWDTTRVPDGVYELYAVWRSSLGETLGTLSRSALVNNSVAWHSGTLAGDEVWTAGRVHVIDAELTIPAGATLTIQAGAVVKFAAGVGVTVNAGGAIDASAGAAAPIVFTSLSDDTAGGDSNLDGDRSQPRPGDWAGVTLLGDARFDGIASVQFRYLTQTHSGTLAGSQVWTGEATHVLTSEVSVPAGMTLTVQAGAVVKFAPGAGLTVQGTLIAEGSLARPTVFTSLADDTVGGDSNRDGGATTPAPGDWRSVRFEGSAVGRFRHARVRYGGNSIINQWNAGGMLESTTATLQLEDCLVTASLKDGVLAGGAVEVANCVIADTGRGVTAWGEATIRNSTVDNNGQGLVEHGGRLTVRNCLVTNNREVGVLHDWGTEQVTVTYSDVWNPDSEDYRGTPNRTGRDGNLSVDPGYRDAEGGDYRLNYLSPAIDAAAGTNAPATDFLGAPRYDDPRTADTGVPAVASGPVPDIGAFEFVETALADVDLQGRGVVGPLALVAGQEAIVRWEVVNTGSGTVRGPWHDALYLGSAGTDGSLLAAGEVLVGQNVVLGPGQSYPVSATVRVPGGVEGPYFWRVHVNSRGDVFEGVLWTNNTASAVTTSTLAVPELVLDAPAMPNRFAATDRPCWFKFVAPAAADYLVSLDLKGGGAAELFVGQDYVPSPQRFDFRQRQWNVPDPVVAIPAASNRTYYVLAQATSLPGGATAFDIQARRPDFAVASVSPSSAGNVGCVTFDVFGSQFNPGDTLVARSAAGTLRPALAARYVDSTLIQATFDLRGVPAGAWDLAVQRFGVETSLPRAFTVQQGGGASAWAAVVGRETVRTGRKYSYEVAYGNNGNVDADLVVVVSGIPNDAEIVLGPEFAPSPLPARLTHQLPTSFASPQGVILTRLMAPAMRPGAGASASFSLTVPSTATFQIKTWTFAANTAPSAYTGANGVRTDAAAAAGATSSAARAAVRAGNTPCNEDLELLALDRIVQCAQQNSWNNNFINRVFVEGQNCVETADDMIDNQLPNWVKTHNQDNAFQGWTAQRITHSSVLEGASEYLSSWHTSVLLTSPCGKHWVLDDYMTGAVLIDAYEDDDGNFLVDASSGFLLTKGLAGVHGFAYDNLWKPTSTPKPIDSASSTSSGGGGRRRGLLRCARVGHQDRQTPAIRRSQRQDRPHRRRRPGRDRPGRTAPLPDRFREQGHRHRARSGGADRRLPERQPGLGDVPVGPHRVQRRDRRRPGRPPELHDERLRQHRSLSRSGERELGSPDRHSHLVSRERGPRHGRVGGGPQRGLPAAEQRRDAGHGLCHLLRGAEGRSAQRFPDRQPGLHRLRRQRADPHPECNKPGGLRGAHQPSSGPRRSLAGELHRELDGGGRCPGRGRREL